MFFALAFAMYDHQEYFIVSGFLYLNVSMNPEFNISENLSLSLSVNPGFPGLILVVLLPAARAMSISS